MVPGALSESTGAETAQPSILEMPGALGGYSPGLRVLCSPTVLDTGESTRSDNAYPGVEAGSPLATARASSEKATAFRWVPLPIVTHAFMQQLKASQEGSPLPGGSTGLSLEPLTSFWEP